MSIANDSVLTLVHEGPHASSLIVKSRAQMREQQRIQFQNGTTFSMGQRLILHIPSITDNNRVLEDLAFRYTITNTGAAPNIINPDIGIWRFMSKLRVLVNDMPIVDWNVGEATIGFFDQLVHDGHKGDAWHQFVIGRSGTFNTATSAFKPNYQPSTTFNPLATLETSRVYYSYLSEVLNLSRLHTSHITGGISIEIELAPGSGLGSVSDARICSQDPANTAALATLVEFRNMEAELYWDVYKGAPKVVDRGPDIRYDHEYHARVKPLNAGTTEEIRFNLNTDFPPYGSVQRMYLYTRNTALNATHTSLNTYLSYNFDDIGQVDVEISGVLRKELRSQAELNEDVTRYYKRRNSDKDYDLKYLEWANNVLTSYFVDFSRGTALETNNSNHMKTYEINGLPTKNSHRESPGETVIRVRPLTTWNVDRTEIVAIVVAVRLVGFPDSDAKRPEVRMVNL